MATAMAMGTETAITVMVMVMEMGNGNNGIGNGNGNGTGTNVSQLMPNTNGITYAVEALPAGSCSGASAGGTVVSCVVAASNGSVTRSATATIICTG